MATENVQVMGGFFEQLQQFFQGLTFGKKILLFILILFFLEI